MTAAIWVLWVAPAAFALLAGPLVAALSFWLPKHMGFAQPMDAAAGAPRADGPPTRRFLLRAAWIAPLLCALGMLVMRRYPNAVGMQGLLFTALLLLIALIDARTRLIPDVLVGCGIILALLLRALGYAPGGWLMALAGLAAGFLPLLIIRFAVRRSDALGLGDVKLMGMAGLYLGWPLIALALFFGFLFGGVTAALLLLTRRKKRTDTLPFGPMLCAGVWLAYLYGAPLLRMYMLWMRL